jgi:NTP pyrophosphatase (non-canonical NTP hydrolase)
MMEEKTLLELKERLREFARKRDWEQFHSPKNLAMALTVEIAELLEHFQWLTEKESYEIGGHKIVKIREEIGDVLIYLVRLSDKLGIDLLDAAFDKIEMNKKKYPIEKVRGKAKKYSEYGNN